MSTLEGGDHSAARSAPDESGIPTLEVVQVTRCDIPDGTLRDAVAYRPVLRSGRNVADWSGEGPTDSQTRRHTRRKGAMTLKTAITPVMRSMVTIALLLVVSVVGGCQAQPPAPPKESMIGVAITGIDHLADHLSVQDFSAAGYGAGSAGGGGGAVCCAMLPVEWRPDMRVLVEWVDQNWRDCSYRRRQREVPVDLYKEPGRLRVHFLADDKVRVVVANVGPRHSGYPGPREPIAYKAPWHDYPADTHCNLQWTEDTTP
ncbi:DUF3304 domain-containing protein [Luteimonas yindakuii]|uniref:DUF3304 domain-containing protein n=1 Tax=Luteimonas yindakuii TaxID=2565782 RepID=UPI0011079AAE|nr:DUF3304 domain-containing protein [Luteimonas yindakuii]QCO67874.2 DUF3304 domain-containing protein [Luteimonas yindakuii]